MTLHFLLLLLIILHKILHLNWLVKILKFLLGKQHLILSLLKWRLILWVN